jgi:hypothetical protein
VVNSTVTGPANTKKKNSSAILKKDELIKQGCGACNGCCGFCAFTMNRYRVFTIVSSAAIDLCIGVRMEMLGSVIVMVVLQMYFNDHLNLGASGFVDHIHIVSPIYYHP